jgi:hypothetical protein
MSTLAYTAPVFSVAQERAEREALTSDEREQIRCDMYGVRNGSGNSSCSCGTYNYRGDDNITRSSEDNNASSNDSNNYEIYPSSIDDSESTPNDRLLDMMNEIIDTTIPLEEKKSYLLVKDSMPELIEKESNMLDFLYCENDNPWAAAHRLVKYWSIRHQLFGTKAFVPMTLNGAMIDDVDYLAKGFVYAMDSDRYGRPIFFIDRIRSAKDIVPRPAALRCCFYALNVVASIVNKHRKLQQNCSSGKINNKNINNDNDNLEETIAGSNSSHFGFVIVCNFRVCVAQLISILSFVWERIRRLDSHFTCFLFYATLSLIEF